MQVMTDSPSRSFAAMPKWRAGFTLIELLVVIGVIALIAGVIGMGFSGGGGTVALQGGQATLSSLVTGARGKAAISNGTTAIVVWGNPSDADSYLRKLAIVVLVDATNDIWQQRGDAVYLPQGAYVVPPDAKNSSTKAKLEPDDASWFVASNFDARSLAHNADDTSTSDPQLKLRENGASTGSSTEKIYRLSSVTPLGRLSGAPNRITVALGQRDSDSLIVFRDPESVRGIELSTYGIPTLVNEKKAFKD